MAETFLLFRSSSRVLALPTRQTRQVLPLGHVSPLPATGGSLLGLMPAGGRAVPLVNLALLAELSPEPQEGAALGLLCEHAGEALLLPIEEVLGNVTEEAAPTPGAALLQDATFGATRAALLNLTALVAAIGARLQPA
jgi:purine-binding chemotaxis protein CheW